MHGLGAMDHHRTHLGPAFKARDLVYKEGKVGYAGNCDVMGTAQNLFPVSGDTEW